MTFDDYVKYRLLESAYGLGFWALVFGIIGIVWFVKAMRDAHRNHKNFERVYKSIMKGEDDDG